MLSFCGCNAKTSFMRYLAKPTVNWQSKDMYERLGVKSDASIDEIKKKYHELVRAYHPDMIQNEKDKEEGQKILAAVNEAYDTLKDENKRQEYDASRLGGHSFGGGFGGFGRGPQMHFQQRKIHQTRVQLSFAESVRGVDREVVLHMDEPCKKCHGNCTNDGKPPNTCPLCNGQGIMVQGFIPMPCPQCGGRGFYVTNPCTNCHGQGTTTKPTTIKVPIPPGVQHGSVLNFNTNFGPIMVMCMVDDDPLLKRDGMDLHITVPISVKTALLGGSVKVPTLTGIVEKRVLPGTQPYDIERLPGAGIAKQGDLYIHYKVIIPRVLSGADRKKLQEMGEKYMKNTSDNWNSYLEEYARRMMFDNKSKKK